MFSASYGSCYSDSVGILIGKEQFKYTLIEFVR